MLKFIYKYRYRYSGKFFEYPYSLRYNILALKKNLCWYAPFQCIQTENRLAHAMLLNNPNYSRTTFNVQKFVNGTPSESNYELLKVKHLTCDSLTTDAKVLPKFPQLLKEIRDTSELTPSFSSKIKDQFQEVDNLSDDDILDSLLVIAAVSFKFPYAYDFNDLYNHLSEESVKRSKLWNANQLLLLADVLYAKNRVPMRPYNYLLKRLFSKLNTLDQFQFTQCFLYLNLIRVFKLDHHLPAIEKKLVTTISNIGIQELGIIALGFFKTKNKIKNFNLLQKVVEKIADSKGNISDVTLCSLLKILRLSFQWNEVDHYCLCYEVCNILKSEINNLNHFCLINLAAIGNRIGIYNNDLISQILNKLMNEFHIIRLKDLERLCFIAINSRCEDIDHLYFAKMVEKELLKPERRREIRMYSDAFLSCVYYLACIGHYNSSLISQALRKNNRQPTISDFHRAEQLFTLDMMLDIEGPEDYQGFRLNENYSKNLAQKYVIDKTPKYLESQSAQMKAFLELEEVTLKLLDEKFIKVDYVLPSSPHPKILFCTDGKGNLQPFPHEKFNYNRKEVKFIPESLKHLTFFVVFLLLRTSLIHSSDKLTGMAMVQIRLLEKLGYKIIFVSGQPFYGGTETPQRLEILRPLLEKHIDGRYLKEPKSNTCRN